MQDEVFRSSISGVHSQSGVGVYPVQWANSQEQFSLAKIISTKEEIWANTIKFNAYFCQ